MYKVSDRLLSDVHRSKNLILDELRPVSDLLHSDKRKHPLTALFGNEGMLFIMNCR